MIPLLHQLEEGVRLFGLEIQVPEFVNQYAPGDSIILAVVPLVLGVSVWQHRVYWTHGT